MARWYDFEDVPVQTRSPVSPEVTKDLASNGPVYPSLSALGYLVS